MKCKTCPDQVQSCPVGDYCWCNGYVHAGDMSHKCAPEYQPKDGWPLANLADPDWSTFGQSAAEVAEDWACTQCPWTFTGSSDDGMPAEVQQHMDFHRLVAS